MAACVKFEKEVMFHLFFLELHHYWIHITLNGQTLHKKEVTLEEILTKLSYDKIALGRHVDDTRRFENAIYNEILNYAYDFFVPLGLLVFDVQIYDDEGVILDFGINVPSIAHIVLRNK